MLTPFFTGICATPEFKEGFNVTNVYSVQAVTWIRDSMVPVAQRIVSQDSYKVNGRSKQLESFTIYSETDKVLCKLRTKHVSETFRAALEIHTYTLRDQLV